MLGGPAVSSLPPVGSSASVALLKLLLISPPLPGKWTWPPSCLTQSFAECQALPGPWADMEELPGSVPKSSETGTSSFHHLLHRGALSSAVSTFQSQNVEGGLCQVLRGPSVLERRFWPEACCSRIQQGSGWGASWLRPHLSLSDNK